jgi:phosphonatase-like hydrolase
LSLSSTPSPLPSAIRLAVLDLAGTTLDDRVDGVAIVVTAMTVAFALEGIVLPPEALAAERGRQKAQVVRRLVEKSGGRAGVSGSRAGEVDATAARVYGAFLHELERRVPSLSEIPGTSDTLRQLQGRGIRVALESGFPSGVVRALVRRLGWEKAGLVNYVIPDEMGVSRPDPAGIVAAMRRFDVGDPREVVKTGDTVVDVEEGRNAGVWTVGVLTGADSRDELEVAGANRVVESVRYLPDLLGLASFLRQAPKRSPRAN